MQNDDSTCPSPTTGADETAGASNVTTTSATEEVTATETTLESAVVPAAPALDAYLIDDAENVRRRQDEVLIVSGVIENKSGGKGRNVVLTAVLGFLAVALIVGSIFIATNVKKSNTVDSTFAPTEAPTALGDPLDVLAVLGPLVRNETTIAADSNDPLEQAFYWIAQVDRSGIRDDPRTPEWKLIQRFVLAALYYATGGANWTNQLFFLSDKDECEWVESTLYISEDFEDFWKTKADELGVLGGVREDPFEVLFEEFQVTNETRGNNGVRSCTDGRVTAINIPGNNLNGTLPEVLGELESLEYLEFLGNFGLGGPLPTSLGGLERLLALNLAYNVFSGTLPTQYSRMSSIQSLLLPFNDISGTLPSEYSLMTGLLSVNIARNDFSGSLPLELSKWTGLQSLRLAQNNFTGTLPPNFSSWVGIEEISFRNNDFSGTLPDEYSSWTAIQRFDFYGNDLSGTLPSAYSTWTQLQSFELFWNSLTGTLPPDYSTWTGLEVFVLGLNSLGGTLPREYATWTQLQSINLFANDVVGTLPSEYSTWTKLQDLNLNTNNLIGTLPKEFSAWTDLRSIQFYRNKLSGSLPSEYSSWIQLQDIAISENRLRGTLPSEYSSWTNIRSVDLFDNRLSGTLPIEYSAWTELQIIDLGSNSLTGTVPEGYLSWADSIFEGNDLVGGGLEALIPGCSDAIVIDNTSSGTITGQISEAEYAWFSLIGNGADVVLDLCGGGTNFDTLLTVFPGPCSSIDFIDVVASNDDFCGEQSRVEFYAEEGVLYNIELYDLSGESGNFELKFTPGSNSKRIIRPGSDIDGESPLDEFGSSVAISSDGTRVVASAPFNDGSGSDSGHVRVFEWNGAGWFQLGKDIDAGISGGYFGYDVTISSDGNRIIAGGPFSNGNGFLSGRVRVFEWNGSDWLQLGSAIDGENSGDFFGFSLDVSSDGNRIVSGSPSSTVNGAESGQLRVFEWVGDDWIQLGTTIDGEAAFDRFGYSVALSANGNRLVAGSSSSNGSRDESGQVQVFEWNGADWIQLGPGIDGLAAGDSFGWSVAISADGNRIVAGAPFNSDDGFDSGNVRVLEWNGSDWIQVGSGISGQAPGTFFGFSVSFSSDGSRIIAGAPYSAGFSNSAGSARVFDWNGEEWVQVGRSVNGENAEDLFGYSLALSSDGNRFVAGGSWNDDNGEESGHIRVFEITEA